jgi:hypothetical protein
MRRAADAQQQAQMADFEEQTRPRGRQILRPKGKSYIGF